MKNKTHQRYRRQHLEVFAEVKLYLEQSTSQRIPIEFLSKKFGLNTSLLMQGFRDLYGSTIHQFHLQCKIAHACKLLTATDLPIKAIARESGFKNSKHFSTRFKQAKGLTPSAYRYRHVLQTATISL